MPIPERIETKYGVQIEHVLDSEADGVWRVRECFHKGDKVPAPTWALQRYPVLPGGETHIYFRVIDRDGNQIGRDVRLYTEGHPPENHIRRSKSAQDGFDAYNPDNWADFPIYAKFGMETVGRGPWFAEVADAVSDRVAGIGLPDGHHVAIFITFQWVAQESTVDPEPEPTTPDAPEPPQPLPDPTQEPDKDNPYLRQIYRYTARMIARVIELSAFQMATLSGDKEADLTRLEGLTTVTFANLRNGQRSPKTLLGEAQDLIGLWIAYMVRYL